jgi:hypothetical protein
VTLHFAETRFVVEGARRFDVVVDGVTVRDDYEPLRAGFATAETVPLSVSLRDGLLEIELVARKGAAEIAAIEVARAGGP